MESEIPKHLIYISTAPDMQLSTQAVLTEGADGNLTCNYMGEGSLTDAWIIPAVVEREVLKGNVYVMTNPDDYEGGMYDNFKPKGGQE
jgi:hypothetical protein